jgi:hypothetical protein
MLPAATDAISSSYLYVGALNAPYAVVRPATDLVKDPWGPLIDFLSRRANQAPLATSKENASALPVNDPAPSPSGMGAWLTDTIEIIGAQRAVASAVSDAQGLLDTAEMLASFLSDISPRRRPQLNVGLDGCPSFATVTDEFYINLTVDRRDRLTWYATVRGAEYFDEDVAFDGRRLPSALKQLFFM